MLSHAFWHIALVTGVAYGNATPSQGSNYCRAADSVTAIMVGIVTPYITATGGQTADVRDSLRLTPASQVTVVTTNSVCSKANTAYQAAVPPAASGFSGRVYVLQAGNRFVVMDPVYDYNASGIRTFVVFDNKWKKLSVF